MKANVSGALQPRQRLLRPGTHRRWVGANGLWDGPYKRQPIIEKRFSQFKTDFRVAPAYSQNVERIVGLLAVYFFALMVQALLERELRRALSESQLGELPLYPEGRFCSRPPTRRVLDDFAPLSSHTRTTSPPSLSTTITTELTPLHRRIFQLLGMPTTAYDQ